jgi:NDP-sugar pyrophosphorylase family protein
MEAIVLAGGRGERLGEVAGGRPKPLVPVAGRPLAARAIAPFVESGVVERVIVSCAAGAEEMFTSALGKLGVEIVAVGEAEPLGRGGALRFAASHVGSAPVLALNGDSIVCVDVRALVAFHTARDAAATVVVAPMPPARSVVDLDSDDRVLRFSPLREVDQWINAGVYVLDQEALRRLPERGDHERTMLPELARKGRLVAFKHRGLCITVNTPNELRAAENFFARPSGAAGPHSAGSIEPTAPGDCVEARPDD